MSALAWLIDAARRNRQAPTLNEAADAWRTAREHADFALWEAGR